MTDMTEAHTSAWYAEQGITNPVIQAMLEVNKVPEVYRDMVSENQDEADQRMDTLDRRIRILDTKYNEILGLMHALGDRVQKATDALVAYTEAQNEPQD